MTTIKHNAMVPFSAENMYDLANAIEDYPAFLPWCRDAKIIEQSATEMTARLTIQKGHLQKSFTTKNTLSTHRSIIMDLVDGPFERMRGEWLFKELDEGACKVSFELSFTFNSMLLRLALEPVFKTIANTMLSAFTQRAKEIYGEGGDNLSPEAGTKLSHA